jgi:hypothetical protein
MVSRSCAGMPDNTNELCLVETDILPLCHDAAEPALVHTPESCGAIGMARSLLPGQWVALWVGDRRCCGCGRGDVMLDIGSSVLGLSMSWCFVSMGLVIWVLVSQSLERSYGNWELGLTRYLSGLGCWGLCVGLGW